MNAKLHARGGSAYLVSVPEPLPRRIVRYWPHPTRDGTYFVREFELRQQAPDSAAYRELPSDDAVVLRAQDETPRCANGHTAVRFLYVSDPQPGRRVELCRACYEAAFA